MADPLPKTKLVRDAIRTIGEALSLEPEDLHDHETWTFLGLNDLLAQATAADLTSQGIPIAAQDFTTYRDVGTFKRFLQGEDPAPPATNPEPHAGESTNIEDPWTGIPKPKVPISVVLQGTPERSEVVLFLFPDGSGAGTAYHTLPALGEGICVVALNSPFLRQAQHFTCSVERLARLWLAEVQRLQPRGRPFTLGGWSAGGYYAFEVAKLLRAAHAPVARLLLIDSPCRLAFAALPVEVVRQLTRTGLLGGRQPPAWMEEHFIATVLAVDGYMPSPMARGQSPENVDLIWCREGLVDSVQASGLEVDIDVDVTRFLLEPRGELGTERWEDLVPGSQCQVWSMSGHHFQVAQPPHVSRSRIP
nr:non-reducing polyketide synthase tera [Quercus suber]